MNDGILVRLRCSVIVFRDGKILLVHRDQDGTDNWVLPGGDPRPGEGMAACARREVLEETGLHVDPARCAFVFEAIDPTGTQRTLEIVFLATRPVTGDLHSVEPGLLPVFVSLDLLGRLRLRPPISGHLRGLHDRDLPPTVPFLGNLWRPQPALDIGAGISGFSPFGRWSAGGRGRARRLE
ncbi:NUDIX domain-containing protein [Sphaerimonospora cavernae]|uniref:NUDIX domain-containing protein n=1 Tax=Sphaerimonospora cavernae TaxID=1740611 RepID=A0ABV6TXE5_9ACTN